VSVSLKIVDPNGEEQLVDAEAPWTLGGHAEADLRLRDAPEQVLAYIGADGGNVFIQPASPEVGLHRNGRPVGASVWLEDGDRLVLGGWRMQCRLGGGELCIELLGKATGARPAAGQASPPAEAPTRPATAPDYRPRVHRPPEPTAYRRIRYAIYAGFALLALAAGFVLLATPIEVTVEPQPDRLEISGFPPPMTIAGQRLAIPGSYRVEATLEGYTPLDETIEVGGEADARFAFEMEKLPGRLFLAVSPEEAEAWVSLDGETLGRAPLEGRKVPAGEHRLEVDAERYLPVVRTVDIVGMDQEQHLSVTLEPAWGDITIRSEPADAEVVLDDEPVGRTPLTLEILRGPHTLKLEKADHAPETLEIEIEPGERRTIGPVELVALPGRLSLSSDPSGAAVTVAGRYVGKAPVEASVAPRRRHEISATLPGHKTARAEVMLAPDERRRLQLELEPEYGTVFVRADPPDARLEVDGEPVGRAVQRLRLQTVAHTIRITKDGFAPYETTVIPKAGLSREIAITLRTLSEAERLGLSETLTTAGGQNLLLMGPGSFTMGAPRREAGRRANEREQDVALTRRFYLSEHLVTNGEFRRFRAEHSSGTEGRETLNLDDQPVVGISWEDAARYLNWLSRQDGLDPAYAEVDGALALKRPVGTGYRLPTEAEWAFAARISGRSGRARFGWGGSYPPTGKAGNFADEQARGIVRVIIEGYDDGYAATAPVGSFPANPAGFYDMAGNAAEWMTDYYAIPVPSATVLEDPLGPESGSFRVVRGAAWNDATLQRLRLAYRDYSGEPRTDIGFRIARYARAPRQE